MRKNKNYFQALPSVDSLLKNPALATLVAEHGRKVVTFAIREVLAGLRSQRFSSKSPGVPGEIPAYVAVLVHSIAHPGLVPVVNATGIILHTNLGRAVLGEPVLADIAGIVTGFSNIEFDLSTGRRGNRHASIAALLRFLTGAEDVLVVNNNAAGIVLALSTLAKRRDVLVSRGELIEIGGEFRIPDIMAASGCRMVEVGTTNRTRIADYEKAITERTAILFKAHKSNYAMTGFVQETSLAECATLARKCKLLFVYDIGSGLIRKPASLSLGDEPDVASAIAQGADLVLFSGDKLLGGPQAGIIAGKKDLIAALGKAPLMRAFRVGKLTMAALASACKSYLDDASLVKNNPTFAMLSKRRDDTWRCAILLQQALAARGIRASVEDTEGRCGGGTLPNVAIPSCAVVLDKKGPKQADSTRRIFERLCQADRPVVGILREGRLVFDMLTVQESEISYLAEAIAACADEAS
jgi:L-seryl-tRNA(Ser) seleniumtransferase